MKPDKATAARARHSQILATRRFSVSPFRRFSFVATLLFVGRHLTFADLQPQFSSSRRFSVSPFLRLGFLVALGFEVCSAVAFSQAQLPEAVRNVGIDQRLNEQVPLDIQFRNEDGRLVRIGDFFTDKPVILSLVYHECPMLCSEVLEGLLRGLRVLRFDAGKEFEVLTVSFNPREDAPLAKSAKESYIRRYKRAGAAEGWHFLTGDQTSIDRLTKAVGFRYSYDAQKNQYAHAGGIMVLTPQGRLSRYFYGIEFAPKDLRLGLVEASQNKIGSIVDQVMLFCYHYDPVTGRYGLVILTTMRIIGVLFVLGLGGYVAVMLRRERVVPGGVKVAR
ncbi:MAG: SCO family protein [Acidobacteriales bacterium]|nr:SCO family protein [Terriglobales bacterium]MCI0620156.1 SCO family protein [Acidobacteriota bacterium]